MPECSQTGAGTGALVTARLPQIGVTRHLHLQGPILPALSYRKPGHGVFLTCARFICALWLLRYTECPMFIAS